ncbi:MAG: TonB-dependent receptor [Candidatus Methylumidiphilus sp.]
MSKHLTNTAVLCVLCVLPARVLAEPNVLDTITVFGEPSTSPAFNTEPISKTELYQPELIERGINNLENMARQMPNLRLSNAGIGSYGQQFSLRGLTNTSLFSAPAVVVYLDDVPYSSPTATTGNLFAIDSVEVYRSSQPAGFGKNAYAGAIGIKTLQPQNDVHAGVALELGNYNLHQVTTHSAGAFIKDQLYFNISGQYQQRDGFLHNSYLKTTPDDQEHFSGRAELKWTPTQAWDVRLSAGKESLNYGASRFVRLDSPDFYTVRSEASEQLRQQTDNQALRIAYDSGDYEVLSVSSRRYWKMYPRVVDLNLTPTVYTRTQDATETAWTQEFRLRPKNQRSTWNWHAGLFYGNTEKHSVTDTLIAKALTRFNLKDNTIDSYAVFGQLAYQGFKEVKPYADLRVDYVESTVDAANSFPNGRKTNLQQREGSVFVSPKLGVNVTLSDNALMYMATGLSFKPSGFTVANINENLSHFSQERLWNNEIGIKSQWWQDRFKLNVAGFYYKIENYQVERFFSLTDYSIVNAPKAHSVGFEVESQLELLDNLSLDGNFGYADTQFDDYQDPITRADYSGKKAPFVPRFTGLFALQYKHPLGYFARAEGVLTGRTYFDESNTQIMRQDDYVVGNIRLGYERKNYSIYAFVKNIADTHYFTFKIDGLRGTPNDPRLFGVRLAVNF